MSNRQLAERWRAQIKDQGTGSNMFYEHEVIYSYGYHFPMAIITKSMHGGKQIIVQNSYGYSNSTAKHLNHMRAQCYDDAVITIGTPLLKRLIGHNPDLAAIKKEAKAEIEARMQEQEAKLSRARVEHMKELYKRDIQENREQLEALNSLNNL